MKNHGGRMGMFSRNPNRSGMRSSLLALAVAFFALGAGNASAYANDPLITAQPVNTTGYVGYTAKFSVSALGTAPVTYQWQTNGINVIGVVATNTSCTLSNLALSANGTLVHVIVTSGGGSVTSTNAVLTVLQPLAPVILAQPTNTTGYIGYTTTFSVIVTNAPLFYQWRTNGINIKNATSASYTTPKLTTTNNGTVYSVIVSNSAGSVTSSNATLTVATPWFTGITTSPASAIVFVGQTATFSVQATGAPLLYQWARNGTNISGATASSYTTAATKITDNGAWFTATVSNSVGSATSSAATLTVLGAMKIAFRPLTAGEITQYGLPSTTQLAAGGANVGLGEPAYLEALITKGSSIYFSNTTWSLAHWANGSAGARTLKPSPLTTNVPCADYGDTLAYDIAGRAMLVPDAVGTNKNGDYVVVASLTWTNGSVVTATQTVYGSLYRGKDACYLCHPDKSNSFERTTMASTFQQNITAADGPNAGFTSSCEACHVLGYDTTAVATNGGFDDVARKNNWKFPSNLANPSSAASNWKNMPTAVKRLANVQCENCHGPGARHVMSSGDTNLITVSLSAANCGQCHDDMPNYSKKYEWDQTWHAMGKPGATSGGGAFRTGNTPNACGQCHSTKGFIDVNTPSFLSGTNASGTATGTVFTAIRGTYNEGITCAACHDPHSPGMGDHQLRNIPTYTLLNGFVAQGGGDGQICIACHHDRGAATNLVQITVAKVNTPHHGTQADLLFGQNAYEFGLKMPSPAPHLQVPETCVGCHMQDAQSGINVTNLLTYQQNTGTNALHHVGGHTFSLDWLNQTNTAVPPSLPGALPYLTARCTPCHGSVTDLAFGGQIWSNSLVSCQMEVSNLLYQVAKLLDSTNDGAHVNSALISTAVTPAALAQRAAYYNWNFVLNDNSLGVHNPPYAKSILRASIAALGGGSPGPYGSYPVPAGIASQAAVDSASGSANDSLGSSGSGSGSGTANPMMAAGGGGTSGSGISSAWGSAPIQISVAPAAVSAPTAADNQIIMQPALELGYHPDEKVVGRKIKFQAIETLGANNEWIDLGPGVVASNAWHYQLISYRDATQRFFRVTSP